MKAWVAQECIYFYAMIAHVQKSPEKISVNTSVKKVAPHCPASQFLLGQPKKYHQPLHESLSCPRVHLFLCNEEEGQVAKWHKWHLSWGGRRATVIRAAHIGLHHPISLPTPQLSEHVHPL